MIRRLSALFAQAPALWFLALVAIGVPMAAIAAANDIKVASSHLAVLRQDIDASKKPKITRQGSHGVAEPRPMADVSKMEIVYTATATDTDQTDIVGYRLEGETADTTITIAIAAASPLLTGGAAAASAKILGAALVLAILLENGLALIFNWRPFLEIFSRRAVQPVIAFCVAYLLVRQFNFDAISRLFVAYGGDASGTSDTGEVLTALTLAGGSSAVNRIMQTLGLRTTSDAVAQQQKPPANKAWIAVTHRRKAAVGEVDVILTPTGAQGDTAIGTIKGGTEAVVPGTNMLRRFAGYFLVAPDRFPPAGGHAVVPGIYTLKLAGKDSSNAPIAISWGPYNLAEGAIINLELEL